MLKIRTVAAFAVFAALAATDQYIEYVTTILIESHPGG